MVKFKTAAPGLYTTTDANGVAWTVEERREDAAWGGGWAWFATSDDGGVLDPMPRLKDVRAALSTP